MKNLKKEARMKLVISLIILLLVLGCNLGSAQTFGFASVGGGLYCNYIVLIDDGNDVWTGYDDLSACGVGPFNGAIAGFTAALPNAGLPVHGAGVDYGDSVYEAQEADINEYYINTYGYNPGYFSTEEWAVHTALKCNKTKGGGYKGAYSWIGVAGSSFGFYLGDNYGFLSCQVPSKGNTALKGPTTGRFGKNMKLQKNSAH
jgi:hypothetical protein